MQLSILETIDDQLPNYEGKRVMIGLSGGINSAAVLAYLARFVQYNPETLYLFHTNIIEHSPDTLDFVLANVEYARQHFPNVVYEQKDVSIIRFFDENNMIAHPSVSPCTRLLKIEPMVEFMARHEIDVDLVGYVRSEYGRIKRQALRGAKRKAYPIAHINNEDCFSLVEKEIGWFPAIYRLMWNDSRIRPYLHQYGHELAPQQRGVVENYARRGFGFDGSRRVFKHNNCLPCKNMHQWEIWLLRLFYPEHHREAMGLAEKLGSYWGRSAEEPTEIDTTCTMCAN